MMLLVKSFKNMFDFDLNVNFYSMFPGKESVLFSVLEYFVGTLASGDLNTAAQRTGFDIFTPREHHDQYNRSAITSS